MLIRNESNRVCFVLSPAGSDLELVDFDSILGDLDALDRLFEATPTADSTGVTATPKPLPVPSSGRPRSTARTSTADPLTEFDSCDAVLRNALLELDSIVGSDPPDAVRPAVNGVQTASRMANGGSVIVPPPAAYASNGTGFGGMNGSRERPEPAPVHLSNRRPSATSISTTGSSELSIKDECSSPETTSQNGSAKIPSTTSQVIHTACRGFV